MMIEKDVDILVELGYDTVTDVEDSPEIKPYYYCFEALKHPKDHPSRDLQDQFYLLGHMHTSSIQIRKLEKQKPPPCIVAPGLHLS
jgi:phenylalanyl-tRNA synthetase alpha chain